LAEYFSFIGLYQESKCFAVLEQSGFFVVFVIQGISGNLLFLIDISEHFFSILSSFSPLKY
jgi:hypothetical protein